MNILLSAINTRHTHSAVALGYLKAYYEEYSNAVPLHIKEFDLNQTNETIIASLVDLSPDVLMFSVYIWSVERILAVCSAVKAAFPNVKIVLGGPEVSYNSPEVLGKCQAVDFIVRGEGEEAFKQLVDAFYYKRPINIKGLTYRNTEGLIIENEPMPLIDNIDKIPCPFTTGSYKPNGNFVFYEASRGCPSKCAYCLSSIQGPVRNRSLSLVKQDLDWFFSSNLKQIRFTDRTFNCNRQRAIEIIEYIKKNNKKNINFHFEIQADFLTEDIIDRLAEAPDGMFHLEIGVQSTNPKALDCAHRYHNLEVLKDRVKQLKNRTKCHLHLDVLGGLDYDTFEDFSRSFDDVYDLHPHDIQVSMIKILKGTPLAKRASEKVYFAMSAPPYTIMRTKWLSPYGAMLIQDIGKLTEGILNTGRFNRSLDFIAKNRFYGSAALMLQNMVEYWRYKRILMYNFTPGNTAENLADFSQRYGVHSRIYSILLHELRMALKVPGSESIKQESSLLSDQIEFTDRSSKPGRKLQRNIRAYVYNYDPQCLDSKEKAIYVYKYSENMSEAPSIEVVPLNDLQAFLVLGIQNRSNMTKIEKPWVNFRPGLPLPLKEKIEETLLEIENMGLAVSIKRK